VIHPHRLNGSGLGPALVNLRSAAGINGGSFAILAETTVTNVPTSAIVGDIGLSPSGTSSFAVQLGYRSDRKTLCGRHDIADALQYDIGSQ
jgi:hypothetical protein